MDTEGFFDDNYLYFWGDQIAEWSDDDADLIWKLLDLEPGMAVLDVPCGHGRIANRLAARGIKVTGLDITPRFVEVARRDAAERGVDVTYVEGDMRQLKWKASFDRVVSWFNSFGYFSDGENREVLTEVHRALRPGGKFLIDTEHQPAVFHALADRILERDGAWMLERPEYDAVTGRLRVTQTVIRDGTSHTRRLTIRILSFPELRDWLLAAGFSHVEGYGAEGTPLHVDSGRMLVVATR